MDDEPAVLAAVARDLRRRFGEGYRILRSNSGQEGLDVLRDLVARGDQVALLVADQRMPGLSGTDFLVQARQLVPGAKRVLLTAYADTEAAIQAINEVALDYYLLKPWDPPEEQLFPVVEDLLTTWAAGAALESGGVRLIGHRFSRETHDLRDFLARNRVPGRWLDVERAGRQVRLSGGGSLSASCVLVASGVSYNQLEAPGFERCTGAGIYYGAAMTEARACQDQSIVVIGGANSAGQAAVYFSKYAGRVIMLVRADSLAKSMSHYLVEQIAALPNVEVRTGWRAVSAEGDDGRVRTLRLAGPDGGETVEEVDAVFVFIGAAPRTDWLEGVVARDERGFILAGADVKAAGWPLGRDPYPLETSVPGVFVAGDVRARSIKRVASAVGEGSMAVSLIHEYLAQA